MRRFTLVSALSAAIVLGAALPGEAMAATEPGPGCNVDYPQDAVGARELAQTFVADKSGVMPRLWVAAYTPTGTDLTLKVATVDATGKPTDKVLATDAIGPAPYPGVGEPVRAYAAFGGTAPVVIAGKSYAVTAKVSDADKSVSWQHALGDDCPGQPYFRSPGTSAWSSEDLGGFDLLFQTYVEPDTANPSGSVAINGGARSTSSRAVTLNLDATDPEPGTGIRSVRIMNAGGTWSAWQRYAPKKGWTLSPGAGVKTVYVRYRDAAGNVSAKASDWINYRP